MSDDTLRQDAVEKEASRRLSSREAVRQDPSAPKVKGYVLVERLGAGAFGEVWKAWQERTGKWVALKLLARRAGVDWDMLQREVERLIKLDKHPNVVSLLDADLTGETPCYAMEFMEGGSLSRFVDSPKRVSAEQAAAWAEQIASALEYVHSKGVLHCDLKPANVLLDEEGRVRVADFGQSRVASEGGPALGTLYFMAPEQAVLRRDALLLPDVRWDIFGLGATIYAVLTGRPPYQERLEARLEAIGGLGPQLEEYRNGILAEAAPDCGAVADLDLRAIVRRCLEPRGENRYGSAAEVAADLVARREQRPVSPLAASRAYRLRRFARRNVAVVVACAVASAGLLTSFAFLVSQRQALRSRLAAGYAVRAREAGDQGDDASAAALYARANVIHPAEALRRAALSHLRALAKPRRLWDLRGPVGAVAVNADGSRILARGAAEVLLLDARSGATISRVSGGSDYAGLDPAQECGFNADGSRAFVVLSSGTVRVLLLDGLSGRKIAELPGMRAVFSPDGRFLAVPQRDVRIFDAGTGRLLGAPVSHPTNGRLNFDFAPDGRTLVTCAMDSMRFWEVPSGRRARREIRTGLKANFRRMMLQQAHLSKDGSLALAMGWSSARFFSLAAGTPIGAVMRHEGHIIAGAFAGDGGTVVTVGEDGTLRQWGASPKYAGVGAFQGKALGSSPITSMTVSRDGTLVAAGAEDGSAFFWHTGSRSSIGRRMVHGGPVLSLAFAGDGRSLATASSDGTVRLWEVPDRVESGHLAPPNPGNLGSRVSPDGSRFFDCNSSGAFIRHLAAGTTVALEAPGPDSSGSCFVPVHYDAAGRRIAFISEVDGEAAYVWDTATGKRLAGPFSASVITLAPDGKRLFGWTRDGRLALWNVDSGKQVAGAQFSGWCHSASFSPDGKRIALCLAGRSWGSASRTEIREVPALSRKSPPLPWSGGMMASPPAWSPDGRMLAVIVGDGSAVQLFDVAADTSVGKPIAHEGQIESFAFSPDSRLFLTTSRDGLVRIVDVRTGALIGSPLRHQVRIRAAAFSRDGSAVATGDSDGFVRLWDARTAEPLGRGERRRGWVNELAFSPDGRRLYAAGLSAERLDVGWLYQQLGPQELESAVRAASQRRVDAEGRVVTIPLAEWDRSAAR